MLFEKIESPGLAHNSYLVGDEGVCVVVDPRRDANVYVERATAEGLRIAYVLETHRNEDYLIGSCELASRTGAELWHADDQWDYEYGKAVRDGQEWQVGGLTFRALHTPGHTPGHMSYVLHEPDGAPWMVFTGDALFAGDVGRVDLMGMDRAQEMARLLHESLFEKILALGDHVLICPAHGAGSVCGASIDDRPWTTVGLERRLNPRLQLDDREEFVRHVAHDMENPPYFKRMEAWNVAGPPVLGSLPAPTPLAPREFAHQAEGATVVDVRAELGFGAAHVPGAISIWQAGLASFVGWFVPYDRPLLLVLEDDDPTPAVRTLVRTGYDNVAGFLSGGMLAWHTDGKQSDEISTVTVQELCRRLDAGEDVWILDVRKEVELEEEGRIERATHIHVTQLPNHLEEVPRERPVYIFCGTGLRSMIAASLLQRAGWRTDRGGSQVSVVLGGFEGWTSTSCEIV